MADPAYTPPWFLKNGLLMTLYSFFYASRMWEKFTVDPQPPYQEKIFMGAEDVPIFGWVAIPENPRGTIVGTYGITGNLTDQWFLQVLGRKAFARKYAVVLFDWRAHGKTAELSPTLTSDGLYEGEDFVKIAAQAKAMGCPGKFWFTGYSLGGHLALWGVKAGQFLSKSARNLGLRESDIGGGAVICPNLDSNRSLAYLVNHPLGRYLEKEVAKNLKTTAWELYRYHPDDIEPAAIERANSIWGFDRELVIPRLGFNSVEEYYDASCPLVHVLPELNKPTLIIYAEDDPMFYPGLVPELKAIAAKNSAIDLVSTEFGGHVGYFSSKNCQKQAGDADPWWAWNRMLDWCDSRSDPSGNRQNLTVPEKSSELLTMQGRSPRQNIPNIA